MLTIIVLYDILRKSIGDGISHVPHLQLHTNSIRNLSFSPTIRRVAQIRCHPEPASAGEGSAVSVHTYQIAKHPNIQLGRITPTRKTPNPCIHNNLQCIVPSNPCIFINIHKAWCIKITSSSPLNQRIFNTIRFHNTQKSLFRTPFLTLVLCTTEVSHPPPQAPVYQPQPSSLLSRPSAHRACSAISASPRRAKALQQRRHSRMRPRPALNLRVPQRHASIPHQPAPLRPLHRTLASYRAAFVLAQQRQPLQLRRKKLRTRRERRFASNRRIPIPRTYVLANVAPKHLSPHRFAQLLWNRTAQLDRQIRNTSPRIQHVRLGDRPGRASINTQSALPAKISRRRASTRRRKLK